MHAFLTIVIVHLLGVASPGPDFAIVVKQSLSQPRRIVIWTALGVALGILVHVTYCLLGIGLIISQSILLFNTIKLIGAAYLLFIGWKALISKPSNQNFQKSEKANRTMSVAKAIRIGFLCNALNPKATLFFLAVFTQVIDSLTPLYIQLFYGLYMTVATFVWFSIIGTAFTTDFARRYLDAIHSWADRVMGVVLIGLGLKVAFSARK